MAQAQSNFVEPPIAQMALESEHAGEEKISPTTPEGSSRPGSVTDVYSGMSHARKIVLLLIFSLSQFLDVTNVSAMVIALTQIAEELSLDYANATWIITAYSLTFASFLLLAGRLADLFPAQRIFLIGFFVMGILSLVVSFVTNKYAFLVIRALTGISGSLTIPSAINVIVKLFPEPAQQGQMLSLFGLSGAIGNVLGLVLAGILLIANYKWVFRFMAIVIFVACGVCFVLSPPVEKDFSSWKTLKRDWMRIDIIGISFLTFALVLFILGLTQGTIEGWGSAGFIAPFVLSWFLFVAFFFFEAKLDPYNAALPVTVWSIPNIYPLNAVALIPYLWWGTAQVRLSAYFQEILGDTPILVAAKLLPMGISALIFGGIANAKPGVITKPKYTVLIGILAEVVGTIMILTSGGGLDSRRFALIAIGGFIGSMGTTAVYMSANIGIIQMATDKAGVAGALFNVLLQVGAVIGLTVQAGVAVVGDGLISTWATSQAGYYFVLAWIVVIGIGFAIFYDAKTSLGKNQDDSAAREKAEEDAGNGRVIESPRVGTV